MKQPSVAILGGDLRQCYLAEYLLEKGYTVTCSHTPSFSYSQTPILNDSLEEVLSCNTLIIGPFPFSRDQENLNCGSKLKIPFYSIFKKLQYGQLLAGGRLPGSALIYCREKSIPVIDVMSSESLQLANAGLTAEGALCRILATTPFAISGTPVLIWGLGRCGLALAKKLTALGAAVTGVDISPERTALAEELGIATLAPAFTKTAAPQEFAKLFADFPVMVNTISHPVLTKERLKTAAPAAAKNCFLFELAFAPGGIDLTAAKESGFPVCVCPGLPGKYSPKTAGRLIGDIILKEVYHDN